MSEWIPIFVEEAEESESLEEIERRLLTSVTSYLDGHDIPRDHPVYEILKLDMSVCAMGLGDYLKKESKEPSSGDHEERKKRTPTRAFVFL